MIFNRDGTCPICGTTGQEFDVPKTKNCPSCKTVFNEFGIILTAHERAEGMEFN
ncbi:MAG: hypothetical protein HY366_03320 [Candidatus Aenigmarchaeota archaeon]|nr:hypothetical protein [Candidatus Aenigmarchaeota archaeon]